MRQRASVRFAVTAALFAVVTACGTTVPMQDRNSGAVAEGAATGLGAGAGAPASDGLSRNGEAGAGTVASGVLASSSGSAPGGASVPRGGKGGTAPGANGSSAPARASTRVTGPLKVGITYIDNQQTQSALGVSSAQTVTAKSVTQALVKGINAAGGLFGRTLQTVEYAWNSGQSNSWSQDASVACERFTKDNRVDVVLDGAFGTTGGFGECLQKAGVLQITRGSEGDRVNSRRTSLHANTGSMVYDRAYTAVLSNLARSGYLRSANQLGVIVEECPAINRAYESTVVPVIAQLRLKAALKRTIQCTTSFSSAGPAASAISGAVLAFKAAGVDRVMFVSDFEDVALLLFSTNADSQDYRPGYALSSTAQASLFKDSGMPPSQWPQLRGVGNSPGSDVADNKAPVTPVEARCLQLAKSGGVTAANAVDKSFVYTLCGLYLLLESALTSTNGSNGPTALQGAINALGTAFRAPGLVGGSTRFGRNEHDGPNAVRIFAYVSGCTCMRYNGPPLRAPA